MEDINLNSEHTQATIMAVKKLLNRQREEIDEQLSTLLGDTNRAIATMRVENSALRREVEGYREKTAAIERDLAAVTDYMRGELERKRAQYAASEAAGKAEQRAAALLSDDSGVLTRLAEMAALSRACSAAVDNGFERSLQRWIGRCLWPLASKMRIYLASKNDPKRAAVEPVGPDMGLAEVMAECRRYDATAIPASPDNFYVSLLADLEPKLMDIIDEGFEERLNAGSPEEAAALVAQTVDRLTDTVRAHGIDVVWEPDSRTAAYFRRPREGEAEAPLVIRRSDNLVYSPGISRSADPAASIF